ncbi:MAG: winged helix-turn-helix transcriptional regulator [Bacteroidetes bacterium]|nr:winged helix-turn-helix transcriptional regulator [Bacteroidota bacterium]
MGTTKSDEFSLRDNHIAEYAKALSSPARIAILRILMKRETCMCGDIVEQIPLSQSTVSQHLRELKNAAIIKGSIDGPKICYYIDAENWGAMRKTFKKFFKGFDPE